VPALFLPHGLQLFYPRFGQLALKRNPKLRRIMIDPDSQHQRIILKLK
jgi:hypothetical protein